MAKMIETNVADERNPVLRIVPLFIKNIVMKMVFNSVGEKKSCLSFSNLGEIKLPQNMQEYIEKLDFILGTQAQAPYNCSCYSYRDILNVTFTRDIKEARLETYFFREMQKLGVEITVQTNQR